jgi:hypothetical protein
VLELPPNLQAQVGPARILYPSIRRESFESQVTQTSNSKRTETEPRDVLVDGTPNAPARLPDVAPSRTPLITSPELVWAQSRAMCRWLQGSLPGARFVPSRCSTADGPAPFSKFLPAHAARRRITPCLALPWQGAGVVYKQ